MVETIDGVLYLAMLVRNVGSGMAMIEAWEPMAGQRTIADGWGEVSGFRPQTRALWIPPGDVAFWQGALRDPTEDVYGPMVDAVRTGALTIDLHYRDHEGG